ncbi:hypothetical protein AMATHDRAFT_67935 [Amanita thiersii Skay4041]|uniref:DUF654-domain-containing protein n=1 Tax=Amanita thiersii Skay4041 TaxID=703135 RepID=A0A2A9NDD9_9AGAR|nr:hypothetical protein AMATHDRAFT_67935 [Amanita thiersii Skay4041]
MPPKLSKRQQREIDELEALRINQLSGDEIHEPYYPKVTAAATFSQLFAAEESNEESDIEGDHDKHTTSSKSRKQKKRKKKTTSAVDTPPVPSHEFILPQPPSTSKSHAPKSSPSAKSERKALKKAKAKEKKSTMDELDQALAELSLKYPSSQQISMSAADSQAFSKFLAVSLAHLDSEAELRKFFGSKVIQANKTSSTSGGSGGRRRPPLPSGALRSNLTKPKPTWWAARQREGLSIRAYTDEEMRAKADRHHWDMVSDEKWWSVEYSKKYKSMTKAFIRTVMSGDPQGFWNMLGKLPWHADTLLQLAEIYRHREEWTQAVDFVDRALFTYERSFIGTFTLTSGQNRLDFDQVENRPFFLAIHRQITDLQRRGCVRTAFEFARLLYSLDPWSDPHGSLFHLDLLALKAGMGQWLLDLYDMFASRRRQRAQDKTDTRMDPSLLPGWAYSRALAMWISEDAIRDQEHKASSEALKEAILSFPAVVPLMADKIDASIPDSIRSHRDFRIETDGAYLSYEISMLHMQSHLYVQHTSGIWKESAHTEWFMSVLRSLSSSLPASLLVSSQRSGFLHLYSNSINLRYSAYRHLVVLESSYKRLFSFIPRDVMESRFLACDPLPPPSRVTEYDAQFFEGIEDAFELGFGGRRTRRQMEADQRRLAQLVRDDALLQQVQEMFDANPEIAERFPGGILQFAQIIDQLPEDVLEDMMAQIAAGGVGVGMEGGEQPMPGGFEGDVEGRGRDDEDINEEDEDDEDDEEISSALVRGLRNIIGRFWGAAAGVQSGGEESISDDDGADREMLDVD